MRRFTHSFLYLLPVYLLLSGCGGGAIDLVEGGVDGSGSGLSIGSISKFGSIFVNGVEYDTDAANVMINDQISRLDQLQLGMYVDVQGAQNLANQQGTADSVEYRDLLRGRIQRMDLDAGYVQVLGLRVYLTEDTFLYGINAATDLKPDDVVRISGSALTSTVGPADINATLLEYLPQADPDAFVVISTLSFLDENAQAFFVGVQRFDYSEASSLPAPLREQVRVEVTGRQVSRSDNPPYAMVDSVRELPLAPLPTGSVVQIEGKVTRYVNPQEFDVEYRQVNLPQAQTDALDTTLQVGFIVKLTGSSNADGIIDIEQLQIVSIPERPPLQDNASYIRVNGSLQYIGTQELTVQNLTVAGVTGQVSAATRYLMLGQDIEYSAADLRIGDLIQVWGDLTPQGEFQINDVFALGANAPNIHHLMGNSSNVDSVNQQLSILGVSVLTTSQTLYYDASTLADLVLPPPATPLLAPTNTQIDAADFFARLQDLPTQVVYTLGEPQGEQIIANELILLPFELQTAP